MNLFLSQQTSLPELDASVASSACHHILMIDKLIRP